MKFWTIQSKEVMDIIESENAYYPDFSKSRYVLNKKPMNSLYSFVLNSFNSVNHESYKGVVFSFVKLNNNGIVAFKSSNEFSSYIKQKKNIVGQTWSCFSRNSKILEIDLIDDFNPLYIDFNDYQIIMPIDPITEILYGNPGGEYKDILMSNLQNGIFQMTPNYACGLIQAHLPYIKKENIVNVYPLFKI